MQRYVAKGRLAFAKWLEAELANIC